MAPASNSLDSAPELPARLAVGATGRARTTGATYRLIATVARGGMGELFLAERTVTDARRPDGQQRQQVIVKRLLDNLRDDRAYIEMFRSEGEHLALLSHPNIVQILDVPDINGARCLALEYVRGRSMAQIIDRARALGQRVPAALGVMMIAEVLEGLDHVHHARLENGRAIELVHRDVTPGNLLVSFDGDVKITDFGIAKSDLSKVATTVGIVKGKARYLAPEQILGERATPRSDLFSVGCVIYELLTGVPLFDRVSVPKTLAAIVHGELPDLYVELGTSRRIAELTQRTLAVQPDRRHERARLLAQDLRAALQEQGPLPTRRDVSAYLRGLFAGQDESWEQVPLSEAEVADLEPEVGFDAPEASRPTMAEVALGPSQPLEDVSDKHRPALLRAASIAESDAISRAAGATPIEAAKEPEARAARPAEQTMLVDRVKQRQAAEAADTVAVMTTSPLGERGDTRAADGARIIGADSATVAEIHLQRPRRGDSDFDDQTEAHVDGPSPDALLEQGRVRLARPHEPTRLVRPPPGPGPRTVVAEPSSPTVPRPPRRAPPPKGVLGALARLPVPMLGGVFLLGSLTGIGLTAVLRTMRTEPQETAPIVSPGLSPVESAPVPPVDAAPVPTETPAVVEPPPPSPSPSPEASATPSPTEAAAPGRVDIVHPRNARVLVDGEPRGKVPVLGVALVPGKHEVTLLMKRSRRVVVLDVESGARIVLDKDELRRLEAE